jgi:putative FmdB family regulatory protein
MPIYVYECKHCEAEVELLQRLDDPPPSFCERCQSRGKMVKVLGVSNFQLKGSGWAKDGYSS